MKKNFYYDLFSLNESIIDNWIKHFFWPLTPQKTQNILNTILDIYFKIIDEEKTNYLKIVFLPTITLGILILYYLITYFKK